MDMFATFALGMTLALQQDAQAVMKANQDAGMKLVASAGLEISSTPNGMHTVSRNGWTFGYGVIGINARPQDAEFGILFLHAYYRPSEHVAMQAIQDRGRDLMASSNLHFYERVNGDIEVSASIPLRRGETDSDVREAVNNCFSELGQAQLAGLKSSDGYVGRHLEDKTDIDMSKVVDYLSDSDLIDLTDKVWGWKDTTPGGHTGPWSHLLSVDGVQIVLGHPENSEIGFANGIVLIGRIAEGIKSSVQLNEELQKELGDGIKLYHAEGRPKPSFGVQALIAYGNGITLQDLHDRIERFAKVMAKHQ